MHLERDDDRVGRRLEAYRCNRSDYIDEFDAGRQCLLVIHLWLTIGAIEAVNFDAPAAHEEHALIHVNR